MLSPKALAALLTYPDAALIKAVPEIQEAIKREAAVPRRRREALAPLFASLQSTDLLLLQERYVACFDRGRANSLYLFEHVHGESRDRGQAMVDLMAQYAAAGLHLAPGELPDFLPAFLEYLSSLPDAQVRVQLADIAHILHDLFAALARHQSDYAAVIAALLSLAGEKVRVPAAAAPAPRDAMAELEALDREWEDQPAFGGAACSTRPPSVQPLQFVRNPAALSKGSAS